MRNTCCSRCVYDQHVYLACLCFVWKEKKMIWSPLIWGVQRGQDKPLILLKLTPAVAAGTGMFSWCLALPCSGIKRNINILWKWIQRVKQLSALFLLYQQLKPAFMKEVDSHFMEFVNSLVAKSALLDSSSSGSLFPASEKELHKAKYVSFKLFLITRLWFLEALFPFLPQMSSSLFAGPWGPLLNTGRSLLPEGPS